VSVKEKTLEATLSTSGALTKQTKRSLAGATLKPVGSLVKRTGRAFTATLGFSGGLAKGVIRSFAAWLGFAGTFPEEGFYPGEGVYPGAPRWQAGVLTMQLRRRLRLLAGVVNPKSRSGLVNPGTYVHGLYPSSGLYPSPGLFPETGRRMGPS
jgi:hypothetical protein